MNEINIHAHFYPLLEDRSRYLVMMGGRGSGKSEFAARKVFLRCMREGRHRFLIMRKVRKSLEGSVVRVMRTLLAEYNIVHDYNRTDRIIRFAGPHGMNEILFDGLDDPEKIKSIKGITSIWLEEATEFKEEDFMTIDLSLREPGPDYHQVMLTFNPLEAEGAWLKRRFFDEANPPANTRIHISTIENNPIPEVRHQYEPILDALREQDPTLYEMWRLGKWGMPKGQIYHWPVAAEGDIPHRFDESFYGLDFGYSVNPSVVVRINRKADRFFLEQMLYSHPEKGEKWVNHEIGQRMGSCGIGRFDPVYADSAEPKSIQELCDMGFNVIPAQKGPDSVRAGIDFLKAQQISIMPGSTEIVKEAASYKWKEDKDGNTLPEPVKFNDHAMDAIRYAIFTHMKRSAAFFGVVKHDVFSD